jgi:septum formation protein
MRIILASGSPRRREILDLVGIEYEVIPSNKEEVTKSLLPSEVVKELAYMKAYDVAENQIFQDEKFGYSENFALKNSLREQEQGVLSLVLGADTMVACDDEILGKPKDEAQAKEMLRKLSGRGHSVFTGIALLWIKEGRLIKTVNQAVETKVMVEPMTETEIEAYVATGEPMDKAGAYAIQGKFAPYITGIEGDYYNVVGFPICTILKEIKKGCRT